MAKAKKVIQKAKKKARNTRKPFDTRIKVVIGLLCLFIALFAGIAMISFVFTWQADQSFLDLAGSETLINPDVQVENWAGKAGALVGNLFIYKWFGIPSLALIFLLALFGFELIGTKLMSFWRTIKYTLLLVIWSSITLAHTFGESLFLLGGGHGKYMSEWLTAFLGQAGIIAFLIVSGLVIIVFLFRITPEILQSKKKEEALFEPDFKEDFEMQLDPGLQSEELQVSDKNNDLIISEVEEKHVSKSIDENDKISVDFNPDIPEPTPKDKNIPVDPEMATDGLAS